MSGSSAALLPASSSKKRLELPKVDTFPTIIDVVKDETAPNLAPAPNLATAPRMARIPPTQVGFKSANSESAVSETASVSGMSSRPVSPPLQSQQQPQKKSKSALKRERRREAEEKERELQQERLKKVEEVHAPIIGRMKKKDKKRADGSIESPPSPHTTQKLDVPQMPMSEKRDTPTNSAVGTAAATPSQTESEKPPASNKTVAQLLQEINDIHFATLEMFKPIVGLRYELHITADELAQIKIRDDAISKSEPQGQQLKHSGTTGINLRGGGTITMHQLVTPGGNVLTGLTQQQEDHFLKLEESRKREKAWERYPTTMKEWKWMPKNTLLAEMKGGGEGKVTLEELKEKVIAARKETEAFEKKLEKLLKRNKKLVGLA